MKKLYVLCSVILLLANPIRAQWTSLNAPSSNYQTYQSVAVSDNGKNISSYMSDLSGKAYVVTSHDYGNTWQSYTQAAPVSSVTTFWDGDVLYYVSAEGAFRKSTDFGATTSILSSTARSLSFPILRLPNGKWYVADAGYNWVSTDKGVNWAQTSAGVYGIAYVTANNGSIVALQNNTVIIYSLDGLTWKQSTVPAGIDGGGNTPRLSKAADGTILAYFYSTPTSFILKSTDNGLTFQLVNATIPANTNIMYYFENDIIAADILGTTYKSPDGGLTFSKINTTKLMNSFSGMITNGLNIYLYGMSGIYRYGTLKTGFEELFADSKLVIYPNPCKDKLTVRSGTELEKYSIYDMDGKKVQEAKPTSNLIDVNSFENGIYLFVAFDKKGAQSKIRFVKN